LGIIDYGRVAWRKILAKSKTNPAKDKSIKSKFQTQWCSGSVFAVWKGVPEASVVLCSLFVFFFSFPFCFLLSSLFFLFFASWRGWPVLAGLFVFLLLFAIKGSLYLCKKIKK
jgi:hypothetical protein